MAAFRDWWATRRWWWSLPVLLFGGSLAVALRIGVWPGTTYIALIEVLVLFLVALGLWIMGAPAGVLINARNCVSLSKLQIAAWTVVVIAALASGVIWNATIGVAQPLAIDIPDEVLEALGIAAASFVAAPALLSIKGAGGADGSTAQTGRSAGGTPDPRDALTNVGSLVARPTAAAARWQDIVRGDDVATAQQVDLGKVQQLLFTVLLVAVYAVAVWNALMAVQAGYDALAVAVAVPVPLPPVPAGTVAKAVAHGHTLLAQCRASGFLTANGTKPDPVCARAMFSGLPAMDAKFVWLLAISHAGYLGSKAVTPKAPAADKVPAKVPDAAAGTGGGDGDGGGGGDV